MRKTEKFIPKTFGLIKIYSWVNKLLNRFLIPKIIILMNFNILRISHLH